MQNETFIFIDESSVLSFNFKEDCKAVQTNTGKFNNEWAFGLQPNSPYKSMINSQFLQYRDEGWFTDVWEKWYVSGSSCSSNVGSNSRFDLKILSGLFYILSLGVMCSFVLVVIETVYAACRDSEKKGSAGFWGSLANRLYLKKREMTQEWLSGPTRQLIRAESMNKKDYQKHQLVSDSTVSTL